MPQEFPQDANHAVRRIFPVAQALGAPALIPYVNLDTPPGARDFVI